RRRARRLRSDDPVGPPRIPLRRGPQILLRTLVYESFFQQDSRIWCSAVGTRFLSGHRGRVPTYALRTGNGDHRSYDLVVERFAAARPGALAHYREGTPRRYRGMGET